MAAKGRWASGNTRLTVEEVRAIRLRYSQGETQTALGREYGVTQVMVSRIVRRKSWTHVE